MLHMPISKSFLIGTGVTWSAEIDHVTRLGCNWICLSDEIICGFIRKIQHFDVKNRNRSGPAQKYFRVYVRTEHKGKFEPKVEVGPLHKWCRGAFKEEYTLYSNRDAGHLPEIYIYLKKEEIEEAEAF